MKKNTNINVLLDGYHYANIGQLFGSSTLTVSSGGQQAGLPCFLRFTWLLAQCPTQNNTEEMLVG